MERTSRVERTYSLGDYKNIKFYDSVTKIPARLAVNSEFMGSLYYAQLISVESAYRAYLALNEAHPLKLGDEAVAALEEERERAMNRLSEILNGDLEHELNYDIEDEEVE